MRDEPGCEWAVVGQAGLFFPSEGLCLFESKATRGYYDNNEESKAVLSEWSGGRW